MSGGKGGSTSTELPQYLQNFQKSNMRKAEQLAQLGYLPYTGPQIAAVNPWEELAAANQNQMSGAFNMGTVDGSIASRMPETVTSGGVEGYSSFPIFQQAVAELQGVAPEFDAVYRSQMNLPAFGDPYGPDRPTIALPAGYEQAPEANNSIADDLQLLNALGIGGRGLLGMFA